MFSFVIVLQQPTWTVYRPCRISIRRAFLVIWWVLVSSAQGWRAWTFLGGRWSPDLCRGFVSNSYPFSLSVESDLQRLPIFAVTSLSEFSKELFSYPLVKKEYMLWSTWRSFPFYSPKQTRSQLEITLLSTSTPCDPFSRPPFPSNHVSPFKDVVFPRDTNLVSSALS